MKTELIQTGKLNPAKYNPRKIDKKSFEGLKKSIQKFGYVEPIIINTRTGSTVIGGHQRLKALIELEINEALCVVLDIPEIEEKALNVALNNRHTSGEYDEVGLEKILLELKSEFEEFDELNFDDLALDFSGSKKNESDLDKKHTDENCELPIVPEFFENHQCFIIVTHNEIDENFVRESLGLSKNRESKSGDKKIRKSNVIDVEELRQVWAKK